MSQAYITAYGDVTPCDFTPLCFGNIRKEPLKVIWRRIREHPAYYAKNMRCRMQSTWFRKRYIHKIPEGSKLPYPVNLVSGCEKPAGKTRALLSLKRLKIMDALWPRDVLNFKLMTKEKLMEKLGMSGEELDKELNKLIEARLVRAEKFLNTTYYHLHYIRLLDWFILILVRLFSDMAASLRGKKTKPEEYQLPQYDGELFF